MLGTLADSVPVVTSELGAQHPGSGYVESYLDLGRRARHRGVVLGVEPTTRRTPWHLVTDERGHPTAYGLVARKWLTGHADG